MSYEKQVWQKYDDLKTEDENIKNGAVVTDDRMNHIEDGIKNVDQDMAFHVSDLKNPHKVTKAQIGLGNVSNFEIATEQEAISGTSNVKYMTPLLTKKAAKFYVDKKDVGLSNVTNVQQASKSDFDAHISNKSNPHKVTAAQVGAYTKSETDEKYVSKTGEEAINGRKLFYGDVVFLNGVDFLGEVKHPRDLPKRSLTPKTGFLNGSSWYRVKNEMLQISCTGLSITAKVSAGAWKDVCSLPGADSISSSSDTTTVIMNANNTSYTGARVRVVNGVLRILPETAITPTQYLNDFLIMAID